MTPTITPNIGLAVGTSGAENTVTETVQALERFGFNLLALRVAQSSTERTVIAQVSSPSAWGIDSLQATAVYALAVQLGQQAIGVFEARRGHGELIGPDAAAWGEFDPTQFLTIEGRPLCPPRKAPTWAGATRDQSEDRAQPFNLAQLAALGASAA
jgi:hypothetical protein